jgi:hypothetical protein
MYLTHSFDGVETHWNSCVKKELFWCCDIPPPFGVQSDPFLQKWSSFFTCTVCANDAPQHKPHPDPCSVHLLYGAARPEKCIIRRGHTIYDQQCGHQAVRLLHWHMG